MQIPHRTDLKHLCEVSKTIYDVAIKKLYENIDIWSEAEWFLERVQVPLLKASRLDHVKVVQVRSNFYHDPAERCPHYKDIRFHKPESPTSFEELATRLIPLFEQLREESLRSFRFAIDPRYAIFNNGAY